MTAFSFWVSPSEEGTYSHTNQIYISDVYDLSVYSIFSLCVYMSIYISPHIVMNMSS